LIVIVPAAAEVRGGGWPARRRDRKLNGLIVQKEAQEESG